MKTIVFKNDRTLEISQDAVNILIKQIEDGKKELVIFKDSKGNIVTVINVNDITCIA